MVDASVMGPVVDYEPMPLPDRAPSRWAWGELDEALVYFIGADCGHGHASPIKIGISRAPTVRLAELQAYCPFPLRILALSRGGLARERQYHARFAAHRLHGEWFMPGRLSPWHT